MAFRTFFLTPTALAVAALSVATTGYAQTTLPASAVENNPLWFVEFNAAPVADGGKLATVQAEQAAFRAAAAQAGVRFVERKAYNALFNGLSVAIDAANRAKLQRVPGVKALHPVETIQAPAPEQASGAAPDLAAALSLTRANIAQTNLNLTGAGIKVGIIDTGIDIDHPGFGGNGSPNSTPFPTARIVAGYDFVGDAYDGGGTGAALIPVPDANPDDCNGHGTHVAGIVGANGGGIRGVAPDVKLGAYRVFGCNGSTSADIMLQAMERALADGMQVINMSIGARAQWPQYPTGQAASRLAKKGVVLVASSGNNGPGGSAPDALWASGAPGIGEAVIGTASYDNAQSTGPALRLLPDGTLFAYNTATGAPLPATGLTLPLSKPSAGANPQFGCLPSDFAGFPAGHAALISRGNFAGGPTCGFYLKALNAQNAGAAAVVLYNNQPGSLSPTVAGTPAITIPTVMVSQTAGQTLAAHPAPSVNFGTDVVSSPLATAGLISGFSSFGLAADLSLKPDLGAPGGSIWSTYPLELTTSGGASLSGTSMASPHVAGAAALILQARPNAALGREGPVVGRNAPPMINMLTRLQNTAKPKVWSGNPALGFLDHAFRQGAGMIDVVAAVQSEQFVVPSKIATGESEAGPKVQVMTLRNDSAAPVTYAVGHTAGLAAGPNGAGTVAGLSAFTLSAVFNSPATVSFSSSTVVVPAKGTATVTATIAAPAGLTARGLYGGYITFTPQGDGTALSVPYAGLAGDYQSTLILEPRANGFPWLATLVGTTYTNRPAGHTFTLVGEDLPYVVAHFAHQARTVRVEALDAATSASRGIVSETQYQGRNTSPTTVLGFAWDGTTSMGVQPNGTYRLRLSVLKPLGDVANPAHWETWTSPVVTIARP